MRSVPRSEDKAVVEHSPFLCPREQHLVWHGSYFVSVPKGDGPDRPGMPLKGEPWLAGPGLPQPHAPVVAAAGKAGAIRTEGDRPDRISVSLEGRGQGLSGPSVPQPDGLVLAAAGEAVAIGTKSH